MISIINIIKIHSKKTALGIAIKGLHNSIVRILLKAGARIKTEETKCGNSGATKPPMLQEAFSYHSFNRYGKSSCFEATLAVLHTLIQAGADLHAYSLLNYVKKYDAYERDGTRNTYIGVLEAAGARDGDVKQINMGVARQNILYCFSPPFTRTGELNRVLREQKLSSKITGIITDYYISIWEPADSKNKKPRLSDELPLFCEQLKEKVLSVCSEYENDFKQSSRKKEGLNRNARLRENLTKAETNQATLGLVYTICFGSGQGSELKGRVKTAVQSLIGSATLKQTLLILMDIHPGKSDRDITALIEGSQKEVEMRNYSMNSA